MKRSSFRWTLLGVLLSAALNSPAACPATTDIEPKMLVGTWQIEWADGARQRGEAPWVLVLAPHPEYEGSLKGHLSRGAGLHQVVADWDDDTLTMEESSDGRRIDATWQATATEGQCAREFSGKRFTGFEPDGSLRRFRMRQLQDRSE